MNDTALTIGLNDKIKELEAARQAEQPHICPHCKERPSGEFHLLCHECLKMMLPAERPPAAVDTSEIEDQCRDAKEHLDSALEMINGMHLPSAADYVEQAQGRLANVRDSLPAILSELTTARRRIEWLEQRLSAQQVDEEKYKSLQDDLEAARQRIGELEREQEGHAKVLGMATDLNLDLQNKADMWRDEFQRIKACPGASTEIISLCERAMMDIRANLSLIDQREKMADYAADLEATITAKDGEIAGLRNVITAADLFLRQHCNGQAAAEMGAELRAVLTQPPQGEEVRLHPATLKLVQDFSAALSAKLLRSQEKYGYGASWQNLGDSWSVEDCRKELMKHISKGDPRDVAAYCAFLWAKGLSTAPSTSEAEGGARK